MLSGNAGMFSSQHLIVNSRNVENEDNMHNATQQ